MSLGTHESVSSLTNLTRQASETRRNPRRSSGLCERSKEPSGWVTIRAVAILHDPEQAEIAAIRTVLPSVAGRRVLEVGCGDGRLTRRYAADASTVTAIDPDAAAIAEFRAAPPAPHVTLYAIGFEQFVSPPASYDVVILSWSL